MLQAFVSRKSKFYIASNHSISESESIGHQVPGWASIPSKKKGSTVLAVTHVSDTLHWQPSQLKGQPLPRWGNTSQYEPFSVDLLFEYAHQILSGDTQKGMEHLDSNETLLKPWQRNPHIPSTVYVIDSNLTLWTNADQLRRAAFARLKKRMRPSVWLCLQALKYFKSLITNTTEDGSHFWHPWASLQNTLQEGGLMFLAYYKDFVGCNYHNYRRHDGTKASIPVFTLSARLDCAYSMPWPTYETIALAKPETVEWNQEMSENYKKYRKRGTKIPKAVWRGSLTGVHKINAVDSIRWRLCALSHRQPELLDAKLVNIPNPARHRDLNLTAIGGLGKRMEMADFQRYAAVIDCDGNAWSSRFAALLCADSVVVKVQPTMVDHFWFYGLEPWVHYVPVSATEEEFEASLLAAVSWVLANQNQSDQIVENAHQWCIEHLNVGALVLDVLSIWDEYTRVLNISNKSGKYSSQLARLLDGESHLGYNMTKVDILFKKRQ